MSVLGFRGQQASPGRIKSLCRSNGNRGREGIEGVMQIAGEPPNDHLGTFLNKLNREDMPLFSRTVKDILEVSDKENRPLSDLSLVILKDPALTAKVLKIANGVLYNPDGRKTTTVSRAVLQLGYKIIRNICIASLLIEKLTSSVQKERVITEMVKSFHAAIQARSLTVIRGDPSVEEVFIATLLFRIGPIAFWSSGEKAVDTLTEALEKRPDESPKRVEKDVLGFSLQELTYGLVRDWGLGELLETSFSKLDLNKRTANVLLGHALVDGIESGWKSEKMEKTISDAARFLNRSNDETVKIVRESTRTAIESARDYGLGSFIKFIPGESETDQEAVVEKQPSSAQFNAMVQLEILSELNALIKDPEFNLNLYMTSLIEGISRGIGLQRVLLSILSTDKKHLVGRFGIGWEQSEIEHFRVTLKSSYPNVFSQMLEEKLPTWVNGKKTKSFQYITEDVRIQMGTQHFFVAPIVVKEAVIGVICADCGKNHELLTPRKFTCFEFLINTSNDVLSALL
jgi:HD-like signal output (HDOD) protein